MCEAAPAVTPRTNGPPSTEALRRGCLDAAAKLARRYDHESRALHQVLSNPGRRYKHANCAQAANPPRRSFSLLQSGQHYQVGHQNSMARNVVAGERVCESVHAVAERLNDSSGAALPRPKPIAPGLASS